MCFKRKPSLGRYSGGRAEWAAAYRKARINAKEGLEPDPNTEGLNWKASLIVAFERSDENDPLTIPVLNRLAAKRTIDSIVAEDCIF